MIEWVKNWARCKECGCGNLKRMFAESAGIVWFICGDSGRVVGEVGKK